jgi:hypothetical protein
MSLICSANALRALHRVLVCSRFEAYEDCDPKTLGDVMDCAEYLVALLQNHEGRTEEECLAEFRAVLQDIEARFPGYEGLLTVFDTDTQIALEKVFATASA